MNDDYRELLDDLRALAADGPREAPAGMEDKLKAEFRRYHRRRKLALWSPALGGVAAAGLALLAWMHHAMPASHSVQPVATERTAQVITDDADASFYPLPEADVLPAVENAMVVRVQMRVSSLRMMGVPMGDDRADSSVEADLLLGQDGLARGVRLVQ